MEATETADEAVRDAGQIRRGASDACPLSLRSLLIIVVYHRRCHLSVTVNYARALVSGVFLPVVMPGTRSLNRASEPGCILVAPERADKRQLPWAAVEVPKITTCAQNPVDAPGERGVWCSGLH